MRKKKGHFWLDVVACFLIPAYTLLFAGSREWLGTNFSVIAVMGADHYRGFIYWGLLAGGYLAFMLVRLAGRLSSPLARLGVLVLTTLAVLNLGYALVIPYLPAYFPKYAALHVLLAALACVLLMAALLVVLLALRHQDRDRWRGPLRLWLGIVAGSVLLFLIPQMVSTALEVFFAISVTLLVRKVWLLME